MPISTAGKANLFQNVEKTHRLIKYSVFKEQS